MRLYLSSFRNGNQPEELLKLLGNGRRTALINNAADFLDTDERLKRRDEEAGRLQSIGLEVTELDLRDHFDKSDGLAEKLKTFDCVWVRGGNCFVLRRAFKQSGMDVIIPKMLAEDAIVYGGYSAGIDMLTPSLHGAELVDDPNVVPDGYKPEIIWEGLGLVPYAIAPHYRSDHPESADIEKSVQFLIDNHILFIALRDGQAIVVNSERQKVVG